MIACVNHSSADLFCKINNHVNQPPIKISPAMETPTMYFFNAFFRDLKSRKIEFG